MHNEHHDQPHGGSKPTYNLVFGALFVLTIIEVAFAEFGLPGGLHYGVLLGLALIKGGLVVSFYMHLKYEPPLFTWVFVVPLLMGAGVILSLQGLAGY